MATVTGEVLHTMVKTTEWGDKLIMLVNDDQVGKLWGTVPRTLMGPDGAPKPGTRVTFTADVTPPSGDKGGNFKYPKDARRLGEDRDAAMPSVAAPSGDRPGRGTDSVIAEIEQHHTAVANTLQRLVDEVKRLEAANTLMTEGFMRAQARILEQEQTIEGLRRDNESLRFERDRAEGELLEIDESIALEAATEATPAF